MDIEVQEPYLLLRGLNVVDLEDLLEDIKVYREMEANTSSDFWSVRDHQYCQPCGDLWVWSWLAGYDCYLSRGDLQVEEVGRERDRCGSRCTAAGECEYICGR